VFYDEYCKQCNRVGKSPSACAVEMGFHKSEVTRWKNGTVPRRANLLRIADYFGCTIDDLVKEEIKKEPENRLSDAHARLIALLPQMDEDAVSMLLILAKQLEARGKSQDDDL